MLQSSIADNPESAGSRPHLGQKKALNGRAFRGILVIGGPTASGKNELALKVAAQFPSEIINADSRQMYRDLVIGTAQPSEEQKQITPHHLYGFLRSEQAFTAAEYQELAARVISEVQQRGNLPIVVGGTGFYIKALLKGVWRVPPRNSELRERFHEIERKKGKSFLHKLLQRIDPPAAASIAPPDTYRVVRALEIYFQSGKKRSDFPRDLVDRWEALKFFVELPREEMRNRIRSRAEKMFAEGWIPEVRLLLERHPDFESLPAAASLGYRRIARYLRGEIDLEECKETIIRETFQYAKRQSTWFRNQDSFTRVAGEPELYKIIDVLQLMSGSSSSK